ncbi:MAG: LPP20 family lipoprotein [Bacteroidota bacterium]
MHLRKLLLTLLSIGILAAGCSSRRIVGGEKQPDWITSRPIDNNYYMGIGKSSKTLPGNNYIQAAKEEALADMASEISVELSSHSLLRQFENNQGFTEEFTSSIQTSTQKELKGYTLVDQWESPDHYWVFYRLSKADYQREQRKKLETAKQRATTLYQSALIHKEKGEVHQALLNLSQAFNAIQPYLDKDLSTFTVEGKIYLGNAVFTTFQEILTNLQIKANQKKYEIKTLSSPSQPIGVTVSYHNLRVSQLPIVFYFPTIQNTPREEVTTNKQGIANTSIAQATQKAERVYLRAELDLDSYFSQHPLLQKLFLSKRAIPHGNVTLEVKERTAYWESKELFFGVQSSQELLAGILKEELTKNFFNFTDNRQEAEVIIQIEARTEKGEDLGKHNLHTAYTSCNITLINNQTGEAIYKGGVSQIKGMKSGSFETAGRDAIKKAGAKARQEIVTDIRKIQLK